MSVGIDMRLLFPYVVDQARSIRTVKRTDWSYFFTFLGTVHNIEPIWAKSETNFCIWESNADTHLALFLFFYQKNISFFKTNLLKLYRFNDHPIKNQGRKQKNEKNFSRRIHSNYRLKTRQRKEWSANFNTRFSTKSWDLLFNTIQHPSRHNDAKHLYLIYHLCSSKDIACKLTELR